MSKHIKFEFDDKLDYQLDAINSVVNLFNGLSKKGDNIYGSTYRGKNFVENEPIRNINITTVEKLLDNLNKVQIENNLFVSKDIEDNNFTVEMETGTGKTYVYLRSILELNKEYGFTKFIIVVPTVAIRTGVEKSIKMLKEHFKILYGIDVEKHSFVYDSKNIKSISTKLVESTDLSICIMNIQAFNKDSNKIRQEDEYGQIIWRDIQMIRPIVIIDEPQKIEGDRKKKSQSLKAIEELEPLFTLRYSATHKKLYNQIYKLDSFDAFEKDLVKKIEVKTINSMIPKSYPYIKYLNFTKDLKAKIEILSQEQGGRIVFKTVSVSGSDNLFDLSGELEQYKNIRILENPHKLKPLKISMPSSIEELKIGESNSKIHDSDIIRNQIRLTIQSHLDKQFNILNKGKKIKVLSLFFIDEVIKVRDGSREDTRGEYLRIFDEEYLKIINELKYKEKFEKYKEFFNEYNNELSVREGYFAIDKEKNIVEVEGWNSSLSENKLKSKAQEDVDRAVELILEKKDALISFEEPLAFIFSHSALREGWDNPNVFNICTLKQGSSDIAKKQEIGRGLRLPVDVYGKRCTDTSINILTVIANDNYEHFASSLQEDFNDSMEFNREEVTPEIILTTFKKSGIPKNKITSELVNILKDELMQNNIINSKNILTKDAKELKNITFNNEILNEHEEFIKNNLIELMHTRGSRRIPVINGDNEPFKGNSSYKYVKESEFVKIINNLTNNLNKRTIYKAKVDKDIFIKKCAEELNEYTKNMYHSKEFIVSTAKTNFDEESRKFEMGDVTHDILKEGADLLAEKKTDLEIINYIMYHTMLPRLVIIKILSKIKNRRILNKQEVLEDITNKIKAKLKDAKDVLEYEIIEGYKLDTTKILEADVIDEEMLRKEKAVYITDEAKRKAMNKYYKMDSKGEYDFAESLENNQNVLLFTKLKKGGFIIDTPYGNYTPDWAIVCKNTEGSPKLYFIVETKWSKENSQLNDEEKVKIKCGTLHFKAVSDDVKFDWVNSYEDFRAKFNVG